MLGDSLQQLSQMASEPSERGSASETEFGPNPRALSEKEQQAVYERYCQPDVCDLSVRQAFHALLDKGEYLASEATVYRVLRQHKANTPPLMSKYFLIANREGAGRGRC